MPNHTPASANIHNPLKPVRQARFNPLSAAPQTPANSCTIVDIGECRHEYPLKWRRLHAQPIPIVSIEVARFFSDQSPLATEVASFRPREQQREMALAVADAIKNNAILVAEAGTGTGKTFAYLVPALLGGGKVIISTGT